MHLEASYCNLKYTFQLLLNYVVIFATNFCGLPIVSKCQWNTSAKCQGACDKTLYTLISEKAVLRVTG
jgi:hypothetical protein